MDSEFVTVEIYISTLGVKYIPLPRLNHGVVARNILNRMQSAVNWQILKH
jgi:hypothetical protein